MTDRNAAQAVSPGTKVSTEILDRYEASLVFIIGCARSGTTLLQSVLQSHSKFAIPPETKFYTAFVQARWRRGDVADPSQLDLLLQRVLADQRARGVVVDEALFREFLALRPMSWKHIFLSLLAAYGAERGATIVAEKSPPHTYCLPRLTEDFPNARFIHIMRDPRAVVLSLMQAGFSTPHIGAHAAAWVHAARIDAEWETRLGEARYLRLRYEDLVADLDHQTLRLSAFLGVDREPGMLEPHRGAEASYAPHAESWLANTRKPVTQESVERWKRKLTPTQIALVEHAAASHMRRYGYEVTGATTPMPGLRLACSRLMHELVRARRLLGRAMRRVSLRRTVETDQ